MTWRLRNAGFPTLCRPKIRKLLQMQSTPERKAASLLSQKMSSLSDVAATIRMGNKRREIFKSGLRMKVTDVLAANHKLFIKNLF